MTREEKESCICTINTLRRLALNIHGVIDVVDDANCSKLIELLKQEPCDDCISKANALCVAKNEYSRGWHDALCKALSEKYSIHCEKGNFSVIQEETITGLGLSMDCAVGKDVESYMSALPSVQPKAKVGHWIKVVESYLPYMCSECGKSEFRKRNYCPNCGTEMQEVEK